MSDNYLDKIEFIADANQALVHIESLEKLLPKILEIAEEATGAEASSYLRYDHESSILTFKVARNEGVEQDLAKLLEGKMTLQAGEGIAGSVIEKGHALMVHDVAETKSFSSRVDEATGYKTRSVLCVPVVHVDEILGVIQVLNPKDKAQFDDADQRVLGIFASLAAVAIVRARLLHEKLEQKELEAQVAVASKIQSKCWPKMPKMEDGSHAWGESLPAKEVGGDLYDCIPLWDGSYIFYVADVSGKGVAAGFIMAALWSTIRSEVRIGVGITQLLRIVNAKTYDFLSSETFFATVSIGQYWPENGKLEMASAGHGVPLWHDGEEFVEFPSLSGLPLGVMEDFTYESQTVPLDRGEMIMLYSDGLNEAFNPENEMFGLDRPKALVVPHDGEKWGRKLMDAVVDWYDGRDRTDDLTLLGIWRDPE